MDRLCCNDTGKDVLKWLIGIDGLQFDQEKLRILQLGQGQDLQFGFWGHEVRLPLSLVSGATAGPTVELSPFPGVAVTSTDRTHASRSRA